MATLVRRFLSRKVGFSRKSGSWKAGINCLEELCSSIVSTLSILERFTDLIITKKLHIEKKKTTKKSTLWI